MKCLKQTYTNCTKGLVSFVLSYSGSEYFLILSPQHFWVHFGRYYIYLFGSDSLILLLNEYLLGFNNWC